MVRDSEPKFQPDRFSRSRARENLLKKKEKKKGYVCSRVLVQAHKNNQALVDSSNSNRVQDHDVQNQLQLLLKIGGSLSEPDFLKLKVVQ